MHMYDDNKLLVAWLEEQVFDVGEEDIYIAGLEGNRDGMPSRDLPIFWPSGEW